jgi:hypothetical protein
LGSRECAGRSGRELIRPSPLSNISRKWTTTPIAQIEKASLIAKLKPPEIDSGLSEESVKAARSHVEMNPQLVALVKMLRRRNPKTGKRKPRRAPLRPN